MTKACLHILKHFEPICHTVANLKDLFRQGWVVGGTALGNQGGEENPLLSKLKQEPYEVHSLRELTTQRLPEARTDNLMEASPETSRVTLG